MPDAPDNLPALGRNEAAELTERIRNTAVDLWRLLTEAHDRKAWAALGYRSFSAYMKAEFDMSKANAYRLVDQGIVIRELSAAAGAPVEVSARQAAAVKNDLAETATKVAERVAEVPLEERPVVAERVVAEVVTKRSRARDSSTPSLQEPSAPVASGASAAPDPAPGGNGGAAQSGGPPAEPGGGEASMPQEPSAPISGNEPPLRETRPALPEALSPGELVARLLRFKPDRLAGVDGPSLRSLLALVRGALEAQAAKAKPAAASGAVTCPHPKNKRKSFGYITICEVCGQKV